MEKSQYFDSQNILAQDQRYILRRQLPEDKAAYRELYEDCSRLKKRMKKAEFENFFEYIWKENQQEDAINVSVFLKESGAYVGNLVLRNLDSTTPELGIDIMKKYRRQGIASGALRLFMNRVVQLSKIEYFFVRVYSDNEPSLRLFQKLGAIPIDNEPSEYQAFLSGLKANNSEIYEEIKKQCPEIEEIAGRRYIAHFRLDIQPE